MIPQSGVKFCLQRGSGTTETWPQLITFQHPTANKHYNNLGNDLDGYDIRTNLTR